MVHQLWGLRLGNQISEDMPFQNKSYPQAVIPQE